jgi:hypothetical protein
LIDDDSNDNPAVGRSHFARLGWLISQKFLDDESVDQLISSTTKTKRPPGNRATFSFQGRIVPTEGKVRQNFLEKIL